MAPQAHTMIEALEQLASCQESGYTHMAGNGTTHFESFHELHCRASRIGLALQRHGFTKGDRLAMILSDSQQFVDSLFGAFLAGAVPVPLSPPSARFGQPETYLRHVAPAVAKARPRLLLADPDLKALLGRDITDFRLGATLTLDALLQEVEADYECTPVAIRPEDMALLQFTSGSTSQPKGVRLNHANLVANVQATAGPHGLQCTPEDYCVSWLPLYHDMGLVAKVLMPIYVGMQGGLFMPPGLFLEDPISWLRQISRLRGTVTFAPNFAYSLCTARASEKAMQGVDLSCLRVAACAAEPIRYQVLAAFAHTFAPYGLRPEALVPCYGLAEHTLGAAISPIGTGMTIDRVEAAALTQGVAIPMPEPAARVTIDLTATLQGVAQVVSCGRFLSGHAGKIVDPNGNPLPERTIGEILLRGPSVMQDYFEDSAATAATLCDGWLHTGDLGYLADDKLYVCGRSKDVLILYGRKYHPQDLEWEAEQVQGIRRGSVVAFGLEEATMHRDRVVIAAETTLPSEHHEQLQTMIRARIHQGLTIMVDQVLLVPPRTLPKTSSGKLQRARTRELFQSGTLAQPSQHA